MNGQRSQTLIAVRFWAFNMFLFELHEVDAYCTRMWQLVTLANEKTSLLDLWEERRVLYEQCMDLQLFYRDTEQADAWMTKQEVS